MGQIQASGVTGASCRRGTLHGTHQCRWGVFSPPQTEMCGIPRGHDKGFFREVVTCPCLLPYPAPSQQLALEIRAQVTEFTDLSPNSTSTICVEH